MKIIIFDIETSGLTPGYICQLSYLVIEDESVCGQNFYFTVPEVKRGAQNVHHLSVHKLKKLSEGMTFFDWSKEVFHDFNNADKIIAHNIQFDMPFLESEFDRCGLKLKNKNKFCTMVHFTDICKLPFKNSHSAYRYCDKYKFPKLEELTKFLGITHKEILELASSLYKVNKEELASHDTRYETIATWLCYQQCEDNQYRSIKSSRSIDKDVHRCTKIDGECNESTSIAEKQKYDNECLNEILIIKGEESQTRRLHNREITKSKCNNKIFVLIAVIIICCIFIKNLDEYKKSNTQGTLNADRTVEQLMYLNDRIRGTIIKLLELKFQNNGPEQWVKNDLNVKKVYGWKVQEISDGVFLASYEYDFNESVDDGYCSYSYEVDVNSEIILPIEGALLDKYTRLGYFEK